MSLRAAKKIVIFLWTAQVILCPLRSFSQPSALKKDWLEGRWSHFVPGDGLSSQTVLSIAVEGDLVWFGTYAGGASCYNKKTGEWKVYTTKWPPGSPRKSRPGLYWENTLEDNHVVAIAVDTNNGVWFGTTFYGYGDVYGVSRFVRNPSPRWTVFGLADGIPCSDITSIATDPDFVWVGTQKGLARYAKKEKIWAFFNRPQQLPNLYINAIVVDGQDVWIATASGLTIFHQGTQTWESLTTKDGLPEDSIQSLAVQGTNIWVGGTYGRMAVYDKKDRVWKKISTGDALDDRWIKQVVCDGRHVWVARDGGVNVFDTARGRWLALTAADGLIDNLVNAIAIDGATIWFGTGSGVSRLTLK